MKQKPQPKVVIDVNLKLNQPGEEMLEEVKVPEKKRSNKLIYMPAEEQKFEEGEQFLSAIDEPEKLQQKPAEVKLREL